METGKNSGTIIRKYLRPRASSTSALSLVYKLPVRMNHSRTNKLYRGGVALNAACKGGGRLH